MEGQGYETTTSINPYVSKLEKMLYSMEHLAQIPSVPKEERVQLTGEEIGDIACYIDGQVCAGCEERQVCTSGSKKRLYTMVYEVLSSVDDYGNELSVEVRRKLQRQCAHSKKFLEEILESFQRIKQEHIWKLKLKEKERECGQMVQTFAHCLYGVTKDLDASIYRDKNLENRIRKQLSKKGIRTVELQIYISREGRYSIELTARTSKGNHISVSAIQEQLSNVLGRRMQIYPEFYTLGDEYTPIRVEEKPVYRMLHGVAKSCKEGSDISGDNFLALDLLQGKKVLALSDGMGSGKKAYEESRQMIELLEELLEAGFPVSAAASMVNQSMLLQKDEVLFATLDLCQCDLYSGELLMIKAGATTTYIKSGSQVRRCGMGGLPLGVLSSVSLSGYEERLGNRDYLIMVTDGVEEALPPKERFFLLEMILGGIRGQNPAKMAQEILHQVQSLSKGKAKDDMMVLVAGLWKV